MNPAIKTTNLHRVFSGKSGNNKKNEDVIALSDINIEINEGELFGLLGPNGAGKTTLIKIFSTLLLPTSGKAFIAGYDVEKDVRPIRKIINMVSGGEYSGYGILTVKENLWMYSQFYNVEKKTALKRIDELIEIVGLKDKINTRLNKLSTGMRQKLNFARGFINEPDILFLDEPTLGLDVTSSKDLRDYVRNWTKGSKKRTVLLTTHYMAEAEQLCDKVAIINNGRIVACDTPLNLKKTLDSSSGYEIIIENSNCDWSELCNINDIRGFTKTDDHDSDSLVFRFILESDSTLEKIFSALIKNKAKILSVRKSDKNLEDVFLALCGRSLDD